MKLPDTILSPRRRPAASVRLDANESPFNTPDNRYPDAELLNLRSTWGAHEHIPPQCVYFTGGTEEAIDLAMRVYALPGRDCVAGVIPTRSIYKRRALVNRLEYREAKLREEDFSLDTDALIDVVSQTTKMIFLCSPNSPTGNALRRSDVETVLQLFDGMVVVDESYVDYVPEATIVDLLNRYRNLIVLRSFSHAWASAGLRLAAVVAHPDVISDFQRVGWVHPVSSMVARAAQEMVSHRLDVDKWIRQTICEREKVAAALNDLPECVKVFPSVTNFLLVRFTDPDAVYKCLLDQGISVRAAGDCIRITIGLPRENSALLGALRRRQ